MHQRWLTTWLLAQLILLVPPLYAQSIPDYMEHWEFGINIDEDEGPQYFADLIVPLYRHPDGERVVFFEPRVSFADSEGLLNFGWGYRQLVQNRAWLLGTNMFYDYDLQYAHYRLGWGLEALSSYAELRANSYFALSQERLVEERGATSIFQEAADGFDIEIGAPIPYYSRVKLFGGFNWYEFENFKNRYGWTLRTEYTPYPFVVVDGLMSDDTKGNFDWGMTFAFRIPWGSGAEVFRSPLVLDETMFPESDATSHLFDLVERHHEIVVEQRAVVNGMSVEVLRGT